MLRFFICLLGCSFIPRFVSAQASYEKGYFVDLHNQKTECYIRPEAWSAHSSLTYLVHSKEQPQTKLLDELSEISIEGFFKLKRTKVQLDISGDESPLLSYTQEPEWHNEELFLWTLVDGNVSLYSYEGGGLKRFFYSRGNGPAEQLVYKKYRTTSGIKLNETFRQTLFEKVNCGDSIFTYFDALRYDEQALTKHFVAENNCAGASVRVYPKAQQSSITLPSTSSLDEKEKPVQQKKSLSPPAEPEPFALSGKAHINYFGLEVNPLLRQIINLNPNSTPTNNPFGIQFASNSALTGRGLNMGLTYSRSKFNDDNNGVFRETVNRDLAFRIGYERKQPLGKRWIVFHGYDFIIGGAKSRTETTDPFVGNTIIETTSSFWGLGPRVGILFLISDRVTLGTESTYYLRYITDKTKLSGLPDSKQKSSDFALTVPVVLILSIRY
ncbi:MAG: hypothetical protein KIT62_05600 [Cyclobacteriaceae bacterium]|nr:hypothetical protein [Cyclobacteriaceae bacterium]